MKYFHSIILHSPDKEMTVEDFTSFNPFGKSALKRLQRVGRAFGMKKERSGTPAKYRYRDIETGMILKLH